MSINFLSKQRYIKQYIPESYMKAGIEMKHIERLIAEDLVKNDILFKSIEVIGWSCIMSTPEEPSSINIIYIAE